MIICCTSEQRLFNCIEVIMSLAKAASSCCHWTFAAQWRLSTLLHHELDIVVIVTDVEDGEGTTTALRSEQQATNGRDPVGHVPSTPPRYVQYSLSETIIASLSSPCSRTRATAATNVLEQLASLVFRTGQFTPIVHGRCGEHQEKCLGVKSSRGEL